MEKDIKFSDSVIGAALEEYFLVNNDKTQKELAKELGITESTFTKYQKGNLSGSNLTPKQKQSLIDKLGLFLINTKKEVVLNNFKNFALFGEKNDVKRFLELKDVDGNSLLFSKDEFGRSIFDYLVIYHNRGKKNQDEILGKIIEEGKFEYSFCPSSDSWAFNSQDERSKYANTPNNLTDKLLEMAISSGNNKALRQLFNDNVLEKICVQSNSNDSNPLDVFVKHDELLKVVIFEGCYRQNKDGQKTYITYKEARNPKEPFIIPPFASRLLEYLLQQSLDGRNTKYIKAAKTLLNGCTILNDNINKLLRLKGKDFAPRRGVYGSTVFECGEPITPLSIPVAGYLYHPSDYLKKYLCISGLKDVLEKFIETVKTSFIESSDGKTSYLETKYPLPVTGTDEYKAIQLLKDNGIGFYFEGTVKGDERIINLDNGLTKLKDAQSETTIKQLGKLYKEANKIKDSEGRTLCLGSLDEKSIITDAKTGEIKYLCDLSNAHLGIPEDDLCDFIFEYNQNYYYPNQQKSISRIEEIINAFGPVEMEPEKLYELLWEKIHKRIDECRLKKPHMVSSILQRAQAYWGDKDKIIELFEKQKRKALGK